MSVFRRQEQEQNPANGNAPADGLRPEKELYNAIEESKTGRLRTYRLRFHLSNGAIAVMSYAYLTEVLCTSPQFVSLIFTNVVVTLKGRNLDRLIIPLQEEKIRAFLCFDERYYDEPGKDAPVIEEIKRQNIKDLVDGSKAAAK